MAAAVVSMIFGFITGVLAARTPEKLLSLLPIDQIPAVSTSAVPEYGEDFSILGDVNTSVRGQHVMGKPALGRVDVVVNK